MEKIRYTISNLLTLQEVYRSIDYLVHEAACCRMTSAEVLGHGEFIMTKLYESV
jgi:hypothetical protein